MRIVATFDPANPPAANATSFNAGFGNGTGRIVVYNESNNSLLLSWGSFSTYCPAWTAMLYCISASSSNINWAIQSTLSSTGSPISMVIVEAFDNFEAIVGTFPAALVRQTNIGNTVSTAMGGSTSLQNDGNTQTTIIEATPSGAASSTISIDNEGNVTVKGNNAGTLTTLLQLIAGASPAVKLAAAAISTEVLGSLLVDQSFSVTVSPIVTNGTVSGSVSTWMWMRGTVKTVLIQFNAMRTNPVNIVLPTAFTAGGHVIMGDGIILQFKASGVLVNCNNITTYGTEAVASTAGISAAGFGDILGGFDTIVINGSGASAHSGWARIEGV